MEVKDIIEVLSALGMVNKPVNVSNEKDYSFKGQKVIVRAHGAGVHYGEIEYFMGREVKLLNSRRMWKWWCNESISLSAAATVGIKHSESKIAPIVGSIIILDAVEIIPCTELASSSIETAPIAKAS